jgi:hypothetical protein
MSDISELHQGLAHLNDQAICSPIQIALTGIAEVSQANRQISRPIVTGQKYFICGHVMTRVDGLRVYGEATARL